MGGLNGAIISSSSAHYGRCRCRFVGGSGGISCQETTPMGQIRPRGKILRRPIRARYQADSMWCGNVHTCVQLWCKRSARWTADPTQATDRCTHKFTVASVNGWRQHIYVISVHREQKLLYLLLYGVWRNPLAYRRPLRSNGMFKAIQWRKQYIGWCIESWKLLNFEYFNLITNYLQSLLFAIS